MSPSRKTSIAIRWLSLFGFSSFMYSQPAPQRNPAALSKMVSVSRTIETPARKCNFQYPWTELSSTANDLLFRHSSSHSPNWCRPVWNRNLLSLNCDTFFIHIIFFWLAFQIKGGRDGRAKGKEAKKNGTATVTKTICFDIIYCLTIVLMMLEDSPCKWGKLCCLWVLEALKGQRFLLSALFYDIEKRKQAMFFKVSKKVSTTLFMMLAKPSRKVSESLPALPLGAFGKLSTLIRFSRLGGKNF